MNDTPQPAAPAKAAQENLAQTLERALATPVSIELPQTPEMPGRIGVPPGWRIETVDDEKLLDRPRRTRAVVTLNDAPSFIDFVKRYEDVGTTVWCTFNPQSFALSFQAVIDEHAHDLPGWRGHVGTFTPGMSSEWKVWTGKNATPMDQVPFAEFLEANERDIAALPGMPNSLDMLTMATDFQAKSEMRFKAKVTLQSGGVALEYVNEANGETVERMNLFQRFAIGIPVFWRAPVDVTEKVPAFPVEARLKYHIAVGKVTFRYELIRPDLVHQTAAAALIAEIRAGIDKVPFVMGSST